jgi:hypothetical protein
VKIIMDSVPVSAVLFTYFTAWSEKLKGRDHLFISKYWWRDNINTFTAKPPVLGFLAPG